MVRVLLTLTLALSVASAAPNLLELAEKLNLTTFVAAAKQTGLAKLINHEREKRNSG